MQEIRPSVTQRDIICAEIAAPPTAMVVFGASGDLTRRKLLVSLYEVFNRGLLNERFYLLGCSRKKLTDEQFRQSAQQAIQENSGDTSSEAIKPFIDKLYYLSGDYGDASFYDNIRSKLAELVLLFFTWLCLHFCIVQLWNVSAQRGFPARVSLIRSSTSD
jgi:glucose-6-phosphate 1-dehydrogenase